MSRNNVRGPTSALTEFLKAQGITHTTVARRAATRSQNQAPEQPQAGPSNSAANENEEGSTSTRRRRATRASGYASDELDDPEEPAGEGEGEGAMEVDEEEKPSPAKKRKLTKAAQAKLKAKEKEKAKKKGKKGSDDDYEDEDEDAYTALSKSLWTNGASKPPIGSFEKCATCGKQFTVTKYTMAANDGTGFLCHQCAKAGGGDPFKKPAVPKKRKSAAEKRNITNFEERRFPTLVSLCIQLITKHINDIEVLGDIGAMNVEAIAKALSKNRGLTPENAHLFYNPANSSLTLFDATNLPSPAFETLAYHNTNLVSLRLDFCGHLDDSSFKVISTSLSSLQRIELLGPFLVRPEGWQTFFKNHPKLEGFLITQSPRFNEECIKSLVKSCPKIKDLRLKEVGKMSDAFLDEIAKLTAGPLQYLDISDPSMSCSEDAMIELMSAVGSALEYLNLSKHIELTDEFLQKGLLPHVANLDSLVLSHLPELTDEGTGAFFDAWVGHNHALMSLDMSRNTELGSKALESILAHSGKKLVELNINGWKETSEDALRQIGKAGTELRKLDVGWCRAVDDFVVKVWLEDEVVGRKQQSGLRNLQEIKVWGCNRVTSAVTRKRGVTILGIESQTGR